MLRGSVMCYNHRLLKIRTDGSQSRVRELGSIGIFSILSITSPKVVRLLQNFVHTLPHTIETNSANLVAASFLLTYLFEPLTY